jgi:signal transduction histidine kinase
MAVTLRENRSVRGREIIVERPDGRRASILPYPSPLRDADGTLVGAVNVLVDVTERRLAERELQARLRQQAAVAALGQRALTDVNLDPLMDEAAVLIARTLDVEYCKILELLPGGEELFLRAGIGWERGLVGNLRVSASPETSHAALTLVSKGPVIIDNLFADPRFHGPSLLHDHGVVSGVSVIIGGRESPFGVLGAHTRYHRVFTSEDINFLQAVANVLAQAVARRQVEADLQRANEAKDEFLGFVSHELRSPITIIRSGARILRSRADSMDQDTMSQVLRDIDAGAVRLQRIVEDLLTLARLEFRQQVTLEPVLMQHIIEETVVNFRGGEHARRIQCKIDNDLGPVAAVANYVEQILENLLSNAVKYSPAGSPVQVCATRRDDSVVVSVRDRGRGLKPDEVEAIFDRFYRSEADSRGTRGLGLGLTVCHRLIAAQSGKIWARPRKHGGLEVSFALMACDDEVIGEDNSENSRDRLQPASRSADLEQISSASTIETSPVGVDSTSIGIRRP